jgi:hypothetical protein
MKPAIQSGRNYCLRTNGLLHNANCLASRGILGVSGDIVTFVMMSPILVDSTLIASGRMSQCHH